MKRHGVFILRSNPVNPDPRVEKTAAVLKDNYDVSILGWDREGLTSKGQISAVKQILLFPKRAPFGAGIRNLGNLLQWQIWLLKTLLINKDEIDVIHACDFDTLLPAYILKLLYRKKIVYDIFDFYAAHIRSTPDWIKWMVSKAEVFFGSQADAIILPDEVRLDQISGIPSEKVQIIYNSPIDVSEELPVVKCRQFTIAYVGVIQKERGLFELAEIAGRHPEINLVVGGYGGDSERFHKQIAPYSNITWLGRISNIEALQTYQNADLILALYDPAVPNHKYASPNKLFEAMMLSKPILAAKDTNIDIIISKNQLGLIADYTKLEDIEKAVMTFASNPELCSQFGKNARALYDSVYSWDLMKAEIINLYKDILGK